MANFQSTAQEVHQPFSMHIAKEDLSGGSFLESCPNGHL